MKAIVNVNKNSAYSYLNGRTFEVKELNSKTIAVEIKHKEFGICIADFSYTEVLIIDIEFEISEAKSNCISLGRTEHFDLRDKLLNYKKINKLQF
jgi:hypothetical protein